MPRSSDIPPSSSFKRRRICFPYLPTEIIFKILLCLPAEILYNVMRFVCREWYNIIKDPKFIDAHLQESPTGFLIQFPALEYSTIYLEMRGRDVETTDLNLFPEGMRGENGFNLFQLPYQSLQHKERISHSHDSLKFPGHILASLNGLVLVHDLNISKSFHVANLISKQWVRLPPFNSEHTKWPSAGLGYAVSCKAYKVACTYRCSDKGCYCCVILTLGADKAWRCIATSDNMSCIPREDLKSSLFASKPYSTGGYVHWVCFPYVLSLEVETERFHLSIVPKQDGRNNLMYFLAMESCLSFTVSRQEYICEIWALVDVEMGYWKKLQKIDFGAQVPLIEQRIGLQVFALMPVALLKNGELLILRPCIIKGYFMICNLKSGAVDFFEDKSWCVSHFERCCPFVKSLVSPKLEMKVM